MENDPLLKRADKAIRDCYQVAALHRRQLREVSITHAKIARTMRLVHAERASPRDLQPETADTAVGVRENPAAPRPLSG
jgi:hypothetical protein